MASFSPHARQAGSSGSSQIPGSDTQLHGQGNKERNSGFLGRCADPRGEAAPWQSKEQELLVVSPFLPRTGEGSGELVVFGRKGGLCEKCNVSRMLGMTAPTARSSSPPGRGGLAPRDTKGLLISAGEGCWTEEEDWRLGDPPIEKAPGAAR